VPPLQAAETRNKLSWVPQPGFSCTWFHKNPTFATHTSPTKIPTCRTAGGGDASPHPPPGSATACIGVAVSMIYQHVSSP